MEFQIVEPVTKQDLSLLRSELERAFHKGEEVKMLLSVTGDPNPSPNWTKAQALELPTTPCGIVTPARLKSAADWANTKPEPMKRRDTMMVDIADNFIMAPIIHVHS